MHGKYERRWAYRHPLAAVKIKKIKKNCDVIYNDVKKNNLLDTFVNGGKLDAFRHTFYMASFSVRVNPEKIRKLGEAHEKDNFIAFTKHQNEDGELPDSVSTIMDLLNNENGIQLAKIIAKNASLEKIKDDCINYINAGNAFYIKRNPKGDYLDCDGNIIEINTYRGKWNIPKCLVH